MVVMGDFIARLAALARARSDPNQGLTSPGIMAFWTARPGPNHRWRGWVTPARRGKELKKVTNAQVRTPAECHAILGVPDIPHELQGTNYTYYYQSGRDYRRIKVDGYQLRPYISQFHANNICTRWGALCFCFDNKQ